MRKNFGKKERNRIPRYLNVKYHAGRVILTIENPVLSSKDDRFFLLKYPICAKR